MFWIYTVFNVLCVILIILTKNKKTSETIAWILVVLSIPFFGILLFILLGNVYFTKKKLPKDCNSTFYEYMKLNKKDILNENNSSVSDFKELILFISKINQSIFSKDNDITLFTDGREKYESLFNDILSAKYSINIEYFIIRNDRMGKEFIELLSKKAKEGITVNLLYDELGSLKTTIKLFKPLIESGGNVYRFFHSLGINLIKANNRNHRKIAIIDGKIGYLGGMNIGLEYMGLKKLTPWRDTHIKIKGSAVYSLQARFLNDLILCSKNFNTDYKKYFPAIDFKGNKCMQIVTSNPEKQTEEIKNSFIKMINLAKKSIYIQTPYFVPDETFLSALKLAAMSGVDIRIMIPGKPDKKYVYYITASYIEELLSYGIKVYLHKGFLHAKTIVTDCEVTSIGTSNFDIRSFLLNYEVNAFIYDKSFSLDYVHTFLSDIENCHLITCEEFSKRSLIRKTAEKFLRLLSPLA